MPYLLFFLASASFFLLHSALATTRAKEAIQKLSPLFAANYRILYNVFSSIHLGIILGIQRYYFEGEGFLFSPPFAYLGILGILGGILIISLSFQGYPLKAFLGLVPEEKGHLSVKGLNRYLRHPLYTGIILCSLGMLLWVNSLSQLVFSLSLWLYLPFGIYWEERKLVKEYGEDYQRYKKNTWALIPYLI